MARLSCSTHLPLRCTHWPQEGHSAHASCRLTPAALPCELLTTPARYLLEEMVPELEALEQRGYFSRQEIKAVVQKRQVGNC